jgi:hypothetical protein
MTWKRDILFPLFRKSQRAAVLEIAKARTYVSDMGDLERWQSEVGEDGVVALEIPRRPYSDVLHQFLGWSQGLLFLGEPIIEEIIVVLEKKLQQFVRQVAQVPGQLILSPDN